MKDVIGFFTWRRLVPAWALLLIAWVLVTVLSACGGDSPESGVEQETLMATEQTATPETGQGDVAPRGPTATSDAGHNRSATVDPATTESGEVTPEATRRGLLGRVGGGGSPSTSEPTERKEGSEPMPNLGGTGQLNVSKYVSVSTGFRHSCGLRTDGAVTCWGSNHYGEAMPPEGEFASVSVWWRHSCGVRIDGTVTCWGLNDFGQSTPPEGEFASVSAGEFHTCGVRTDGSVTRWGHQVRGLTSGGG